MSRLRSFAVLVTAALFSGRELQQRFLHMMKLLQQTDVRPTSRALDAVPKLQERLRSLARRWEEVRP